MASRRARTGAWVARNDVSPVTAIARRIVKNVNVTFTRQLDDRIRELSARLLSSQDPEEFSLTLCELQSVIRQRIVRLRKATVVAVNEHPAFPQERRRAS